MHIFIYPATAYTATPFVHQTFCLYNNYLILFTLFKEKKKKTDRYYVLKEILYEILSLEASIQSKKIVSNKIYLIYVTTRPYNIESTVYSLIISHVLQLKKVLIDAVVHSEHVKVIKYLPILCSSCSTTQRCVTNIKLQKKSLDRSRFKIALDYFSKFIMNCHIS
jgi:hypothetical protein